MPKKSSYDIISIGEAGLDTFLKLHDASLLCSVDKKSCWLCLTYADKIPVEDLHESLGHNACNLSVGAARLGLRPALYTTIGDDDIGKKILERLKAEKVSTEYVAVEKGGTSSTSVVLNYRTERTILIYHAPKKFVLPRLANASWIYLTSLGKGFEKIHRALLAQMKRNGWKLAFNPGDQQLRAGVKALGPTLRACTVLILNKEEAETLIDKSCKINIKEVLEALHHLGPEIVVITDGPAGAYGFDGHRFLFSKPLPAHVVERTGAGDSFSTGLLSALVHGKKLDEALLWGSANAASVIEYIGPQQGLLTRSKLLMRIKKMNTYVQSL